MTLNHATLNEAALDQALRAVPPVWPLAATVAVNPFLGQAGLTLAETAALLARVAGAPVTLPRAHYAALIASGRITDADLDAALAADGQGLDRATVRAALGREGPRPVALPTVAELAAEATGTDWPGIVADRLGAFLAGWFDEGQALWRQSDAGGLYTTWRAMAIHDLTTEILGLAGFARFAADLPATAEAAMGRAVATLAIPPDAQATAFHRLQMTLVGWAQIARRRLFEAEQAGGRDETGRDLLAIALAYEEALFLRHKERIAARWGETVAAHAVAVAPSLDQRIDAVLQLAWERSEQRGWLPQIGPRQAAATAPRPSVQMAFCIDVRSEVFRRALEAVMPGVQTLGFAGFFGLPIAHRDFASDTLEARLPVLLSPSMITCTAATTASGASDADVRIAARARRACGRFRTAAVSSFAFVEAAGPIYAAKLVQDGFAGGRAEADDSAPAPQWPADMTIAARVDTAIAVMNAMGLHGPIAPLLVLAGHGASAVNNPFLSALHCGACGGHAGDVNARLLAALLNDPAVRAGLAAKGRGLPEDTLVVGALHDTTTDAVTLYAEDRPSPAHRDALAALRKNLEVAGQLARRERQPRLPGARSDNDVLTRARDWAQLRPEWGLAGCQAFIAAPRDRTAGRDFAGRAFLHDYDWRKDAGFGVLELILTAPVVVASWISLQYYGSSVAPAVFGAGDKLLHNVVGGFGVVEGNGGALRSGLPWPSVHDGERLMHDPLRLTVVVEAPRSAIEGVLERHPQVRTLFDRHWLHLVRLGEDGRPAERLADAGWTAV